MIPYGIDTPARQVGYFSLAVLTVAITPWIAQMGNVLGCDPLIPSAFALFIASIHVCDFLFPRIPFMPGLMRITSLHGTWRGTLERTVEGKTETRNVTLRIHQTWRRIGVTLEGETSISVVRLAHLSTGNPDSVSIKWVYDSRPCQGQRDLPLAYGEGVTELFLSTDEEGASLKGHYYSSKLRRGNLRLKRET